MGEVRTVLTGRGLVESPRWYGNRLYLSDWSSGEVLAVDPAGTSETVARVASLPLCTAFLPGGALLIVSSPNGRLLRREPDGTLATHADLGRPGWNDIVADGRGNVYVNRPGFDPTAGEPFRPGGLSRRRDWADLGQGVPDGICVDADNAVWYADVPNRCCVRVAEHGTELRRIELDRGGFACVLGGPDRSTLYIAAAQWQGMTQAEMVAPGTGQVLAVEVEVPGAGWP